MEYRENHIKLFTVDVDKFPTPYAVELTLEYCLLLHELYGY